MIRVSEVIRVSGDLDNYCALFEQTCVYVTVLPR